MTRRWPFSGIRLVFPILCLMGTGWAPPGHAAPTSSVTQVTEDLRASDVYSIYSKFMVQIDLLAHPQTAGLPITVNAIRPGTLLVEGTVPSAKMRDYVIQNARRITGLDVEATLEIVEDSEEVVPQVDAALLEQDAQEIVTGFFPELAGSVRVTASRQGIIEINGEAPSYETKYNVSRLVKSQQGCRAAINLMRVTADTEAGMINVSEAGDLRLLASKLPLIPAAPLLNDALADAPAARKGLRESAMNPPLADDAPTTIVNRSKHVEDAKAIITRNPDLALLELEYEADGDELLVSGKMDARADVEKVVEALSEITEIRSLTVRSRPYSMHRTFPAPAKSTDSDASEKKTFTDRLKSAIPWNNGDDGPEAMAKSWRYRESIRKDLLKLAEKRVDDVALKAIPRGLLIEARVASARDRAFVLKQISNMPSLRTMPLDVVLHINEE